MRMQLGFQLQNEAVALNFRETIISFFKKATQEHDPQLYDALYKPGNTQPKQFCFAVYLPQAVFQEQQFRVVDKMMRVTLSTPDAALFIGLYNAFLLQKKKAHPMNGNSMELETIALVPEKQISQSQMDVQLASPLLVRWHERDSKDAYYIWRDEPFLATLKQITQQRLNGVEGINPEWVADLQIEPLQCKMVVVRCFGQKFPATLGRLRLTGHPRVLKYLYDSGLGAKVAVGFGLLQ